MKWRTNWWNGPLGQSGSDGINIMAVSEKARHSTIWQPRRQTFVSCFVVVVFCKRKFPEWGGLDGMIPIWPDWILKNRYLNRSSRTGMEQLNEWFAKHANMQWCEELSTAARCDVNVTMWTVLLCGEFSDERWELDVERHEMMYWGRWECVKVWWCKCPLATSPCYPTL